MMVISERGVWRLRCALVVAMLIGAHTWLVPANGLPQDLENRDVERAVDAIAAGIDTWLSRLRFYCSFELYVAGLLALTTPWWNSTANIRSLSVEANTPWAMEWYDIV